jgi:hypothetical protein
MAADPYNVRERLWKAIYVLATSASSIQERVDNACSELAPLRADDFADPKARAIIGAIGERSTAHRNGPATLLMLTDGEAAALAKQIFELDSMYRPPFDDE